MAKHSTEIDKLPVIDRWLLSKLNSLIKTVDKGLEQYDITGSGRAIAEFTDELSNWYVRRNRERFWAVGMEQDKINAYSTLYTALVTLAKLSAPFVPFMAESIYLNLVKSQDDSAPISIHLCDFPVADESVIDKPLEDYMDDVLHIVVMGRAARNNCSIKNRQPIGTMYIVAPKILPEEYTLLIADELNIKKIAYTTDTSTFFDYKFKPQLKTLGKKLGKLLPQASEAIKSLPGIQTMDLLKAQGKITLNIDGQEFELLEEDVIVETIQPEGLSTESDRNFTVALDTVLSQELIEEGFVREIVSKIQTMRKEAGFEVLDRIRFGFSTNEMLKTIILNNKIFIAEEVLADNISEEISGYEKDWDINGEAVKFSVEKSKHI